MGESVHRTRLKAPRARGVRSLRFTYIYIYICKYIYIYIYIYIYSRDALWGRRGETISHRKQQCSA